MKVFRDPVHNLISFDKEDEKIFLDLIDSKEFQRLRHIRQLGLSSYTYPGAEHTRFAHSIGVAHLMKRVVSRLGQLEHKEYSEEILQNRTLAVAAALLHDIGHGPFSHAMEDVTGEKHEKWTVRIVTDPSTETHQILESYKDGFSKEVADVIQRTHSSKVLVKLLSSQLDTDRIDYMLRDSLMTGARYGSFDLEWLINTLRIGEVQGVTEVGLDLHKGKSIAEDFVMARYYMYKHVYFHKTTRCAELIIKKIFERVKELHCNKKADIELSVELEAIFTFSKQETFPLEHYLCLTDHTIWHYIYIWSKHNDPILSNLCKRVLHRNLYKAVEAEIDQMDWIDIVEIVQSKTDLPRNYWFLKDNPQSSSYKDPYLGQKEKSDESETELEATEQIFLFNHDGTPIELSQASEIINTIRNGKITSKKVYVPEDLHPYIMDAIKKVGKY